MDLFGGVLLTEETIAETSEKHDLEDLVDYVTSRQPVNEGRAESRNDENNDGVGRGRSFDSKEDVPLTTRESFFGGESKVHVPTTITAVKTQLIFRADLKIDFIPDWIFNLGIRSTTSMVIPMLEHHATLFGRDEVHHYLMETNVAVYDLIEKRLNDYRDRPQASFPALVKHKSSKKQLSTTVPVEENPMRAAAAAAAAESS